MSDPVVTNVLKSGAVLWVAPVDEAIPDETTVDFDAAWGGNWARVGYTKVPLTIAYDSEESDVEVEEELAPINRHRVKENLTWETVLAELTSDYLQLAAANQTDVATTAAGASQRGYDTSGVGGVATLTKKAWGIEGVYVDADGAEFPVRFFMWKGTAKLNGNLEFSKKSDDYIGVPVQIKGLAHTTKSSGHKLMDWQRVTAEATS